MSSNRGYADAIASHDSAGAVADGRQLYATPGDAAQRQARDAAEFIGCAVDGAKRVRVRVDDLLFFSRVMTRRQAFEPTNGEKGLQMANDTLRILNSNAIRFQCEVPPEVHAHAKRKDGVPIWPRSIGLSIWKKTAELHGGSIGVEWSGKEHDVPFHASSERRTGPMNSAANPRPIEVLLVEDNPGDVRLTREALRNGKVLNNLLVVLTTSWAEEDVLRAYNSM